MWRQAVRRVSAGSGFTSFTCSHMQWDDAGRRACTNMHARTRGRQPERNACTCNRMQCESPFAPGRGWAPPGLASWEMMLLLGS